MMLFIFSKTIFSASMLDWFSQRRALGNLTFIKDISMFHLTFSHGLIESRILGLVYLGHKVNNIMG